MILGRVIFRLEVPFPFHRHDMDKYRLVVFFCKFEYVFDFLGIVSVKGPPVVDVHLVEDVDRFDD